MHSLANTKQIQPYKKEEETICELQINHYITIKEADKWSAAVIMDTEQYKSFVSHFLEDATYYENVANYQQSQIISKLNTWIYEYQNNITENERSFLTKFSCKTNKFYGISRIYTSIVITKAYKKYISTCMTVPHPTYLKLRPIVEDPNCERHRLINFINIL